MNPLFRNVGYAAVVAMIAVFVFLEVTGPFGVKELFNKRSRIEELQQQNSELERDNRMRSERIVRLKESQEEQELEIRRRYMKQKPGTVDFILPPGETAAHDSGETFHGLPPFIVRRRSGEEREVIVQRWPPRASSKLRDGCEDEDYREG